MGEPALIEHQWYWKANSQECFFLVLLKYWKLFHLLNYIFTVCISFISESMAIWSFIRDSLVKQWGNKRAQFSSPLCRGKTQWAAAAETSAHFPCTGNSDLRNSPMHKLIQRGKAMHSESIKQRYFLLFEKRRCRGIHHSIRLFPWHVCSHFAIILYLWYWNY